MITNSKTDKQQEKATLRRVVSLVDGRKNETYAHRQRRQLWLDYYFGRQWSAKNAARIRKRDQDPVRVNRVRPTARLMWGLITVAPLDIRLTGQNPQTNTLAEAFQAVLKVNETNNKTESQETFVSFHGIVAGEGWSYVGAYVRNDDPSEEIVQERFIDPREITIDPGCVMPDASDLTWLDWAHSVNKLDLLTAFPERAQDILQAAGVEPDPTGASGSTIGTYVKFGDSRYANSDAYTFQTFSDQTTSFSRSDYANVIVHEFWEQRPADVVAVQQKGSPTPDVFFPDDARLPAAMLTCERYWHTKAKVPFCTIYIDNAVLATFRSPYLHRQIPFVRFAFELDDRKQAVGIVDDLLDIQDGVNQFRTRIAYELATKWWFVDPSAPAASALKLDEVADQLEEDAGGVVMLKPESVKEVNNLGTIAALSNMMDESKQEIQYTSGINQEAMGYPVGRQSGKAKEIAIGQSQMLQRPVEVNWIAYKVRKAELRISLLQQYLDSFFIIDNIDPTGEQTFYEINKRITDDQGNEVVLTDITKGRFKVVIDTSPATAANKEKAVSLFNELAVNEPDPVMRDTYKRIALEIGGLPFKRRYLEMVDEASKKAEAMRQAQTAQAQPPQEAVGQQLRG